jgi:hypothetical protein
VEYEIQATNEFSAWFEDDLTLAEQKSVTRVVKMLKNFGPGLPFPYSSGISGSKFSHMRELRIQHQGRPYRVLYAFDPRRAAVLLIGGDKTGNERWYNKMVPIADSLYEDHLKEIRKKT